MERFAANLRAEREARGYSQERLGDLAGLHMTEVSRLERAVRQPRLMTIVRLARALAIEPSRLLKNLE